MSVAAGKRIDQEKLGRVADGLVAAVAAVLPWSTSLTLVFAGLWLVALIPTLDRESARDTLRLPAAWLPLALIALAALGMLWTNVPFGERFRGFDAFLKLLAVPLLLIQFRRSERGHWVFWAFLASCTLLQIVSYASFAFPHALGRLGRVPGVPVRDYIAQSAEFTVCAFGLFYLALRQLQGRRLLVAAGLALFGFSFLANMFFVVSSRTALVTIPLLVLIFALTQCGWRSALSICLAALAAAVAIWWASANVRDRLGNITTEIEIYQSRNERTSSGERLEFWKKSIDFISRAPIIGHGTGTIHALFKQAAEGKTGVAGLASANPHNQTFAVAIQLGFAGAALLFAIWLAHLLLFRGAGLAAWIGLSVVAQNMVGSLFNSHLFDFAHAWLYVLGVGVAGGMVLARAKTAHECARSPVTATS